MSKKTYNSYWSPKKSQGATTKQWWEEDEDLDRYSGSSWWKSSYSYKKDKTNIIDPELDWLTRSDLKWGVRNYVEKLSDPLKALYNKGVIDEEVVQDIFKSYNYRAEDIALINTEKPEHAWKVKLLDKLSNHYLKTVTRGNDLYSTIVTRNMVGTLLQLLHQFNEQDKNNGGQGKKSLEEMLAELGDGDLDKQIQKGADAAMQQIETIGNELTEMVGGKEAGKMSTDIKTLEVLQEIEEFKKLLNIRPEQISKFIKGCYKRIVSYYNPHSTIYEEPFLEAESIEGMDELEQLLPLFRLVNLEDLVIQAHKSSFKFDVYIDASGSMSDTVNIGGKRITLYNLCRYLTIKLHSMGLVKDIYLFETSVKKMSNVFELMRSSWGGGTRFTAVLETVGRTNMSSVILTDMCDEIKWYNRNCYFIGVRVFHPQGNADTLKAYDSSKQFMLFTEKGEFKRPILGKDY